MKLKYQLHHKENRQICLSLPKEVLIQKRAVDKLAKSKQDLEKLLSSFQIFMIKLRIFKVLPTTIDLRNDFFTLMSNSDT